MYAIFFSRIYKMYTLYLTSHKNTLVNNSYIFMIVIMVLHFRVIVYIVPAYNIHFTYMHMYMYYVLFNILYIDMSVWL